MSYGVVRTDLMYATDVRSGLVSVKYIVTAGDPAVSTPTEIENGNVLKLGALLEGEREIFEGTAPAADTPLSEVVLVASPEVMYDERKKNLDEFINEAGKACRGYRLHTGDVFSVTKDALDGAAEPAVGDVVELKAGTKLNVVAASTGATEGSTVVGKIHDIEVAGRYTYYASLVG
ncbi:MAG: hypothetical protein J6Y20_10380 [Lachnospiraceae bacterium]|nr:hypothetical protein [Lachnospiraceae bacterium]